MATIDDEKIVNRIIENNGYFDNDPFEFTVVKIVEYTNFAGRIVWGLIFEHESLDKYKASEYIYEPTTLWINLDYFKSLSHCSNNGI